MNGIDELREVLMRQALRFRTGVLLHDRVDRDSMDPFALQLQAFILDYHEVISSRLTSQTRVVTIDHLDIIDDLRKVASSEGPSPCSLVLNMDLALAKLGKAEISAFWDSFSQLQPFGLTAIVLAIPAAAASVQPSGQSLASWKEWRRIAEGMRQSLASNEETV